MRYSYLIEGYRNNEEESSVIDSFASSKKSSFAIANRFLFYYGLEKVVISRVSNAIGSSIEIVKVFK